VARELTKLHEEVFRGTLREAAAHFEAGVRGEVVLVVGPRPAGDAPRPPDLEGDAREMAARGLGARDIRAALMRTGLDRNRAYALALEATRGANEEEEGS
jgi:16S rRNA (cytidine1402-2'-O)-methyltransferase